MKILLITEAWAPQVGGVQNYLKNVVRLLRELGHEVVVVTSVAQADPSPRLGRGAPLGKGSKTTIRRRFFSNFARPKWLFFYLWLRKFVRREKVDVILCGTALFAGLPALWTKKKLNVPYVVFTYGMEIKTWMSERGTKKKLEKVLRGADKVVCINDEMKGVLNEYSKNVVKVLPGVDERFLREVNSASVEATKKHYGLNNEYVLSVGRLIKRKGFDDLVTAFSQLDQTKFANTDLVIVGDGPEKDALLELANDELLGERVKILDNVPSKHLPALYAGAELFALTPKETETDVEGFGIVYLEAAGLGVAAVGTRTGGVSEAVLDGETGLLVGQGNIESISDALNKLLGDDDLRKKMGESARGRVPAEFAWEKRKALLQSVV